LVATVVVVEDVTVDVLELNGPETASASIWRAFDDARTGDVGRLPIRNMTTMPNPVHA
jgi:hypothetical protein